MLSNFAFLEFTIPEVIIILVIILVWLGGKKLSELSKISGKSIRDLNKGLTSSIDNDKRRPKTKSGKSRS